VRSALSLTHSVIGDESYFEEIRSFMGKVTTDGRMISPLNQHHRTSIPPPGYHLNHLPHRTMSTEPLVRPCRSPQHIDTQRDIHEDRKRERSFSSDKDNFSSRSSSSSLAGSSLSPPRTASPLAQPASHQLSPTPEAPTSPEEEPSSPTNNT
jgi:hypothetical protein